METNQMALQLQVSSNLPELIPIGESKEFPVNGRDVHLFLGVKTNFRDWMPERLTEMDAIEGQDFRSFLGESTGGRPSKEFHLSIDVAKHVAMLERTIKGRQLRQWFIARENRLKELERGLPLPSYPEALRQLANTIDANTALVAKNRGLEKTVELVVADNSALVITNQVLVPKAEHYDAVMDSDGYHSVGAAAKILGTGPIRLFDFMKDKGFTINSETPMQKYLEQGWFVVKETTVPKGRDKVTGELLMRPRPQIYVTPKGLEQLRKAGASLVKNRLR